MKPTVKQVQAIAFAARDVAVHIRRYWSIDGKPLPTPVTRMAGHAGTFKHTLDLITEWERQIQGLYPGQIIELQLRELLYDWYALAPYPPRSYHEPTWLLGEWEGWDEQLVLIHTYRMYQGMSEIMQQTSKGIPRSFLGEAVNLIEDAAQQVLTGIAFVPNVIQSLILEALKGRAITAEGLLAEDFCGSKETLYGKQGRGGLGDLRDHGLVVLDRKMGGFYRPDFPPE